MDGQAHLKRWGGAGRQTQRLPHVHAGQSPPRAVRALQGRCRIVPARRRQPHVVSNQPSEAPIVQNIRGSSPMKRFIFRNSQLDQCNFLIPSHIIATSLMINVIIGQLSELDPLTL